MPELPEVETVARKLSPQITGEVVQSWEVYDSRLNFPRKNQLLSQATIAEVTRLGKQVLIQCDDPAECFLAIHLRMSGRLFWSAGKPGSLKNDFEKYQTDFSLKSLAHLRIRFLFKNGALLFVDPRRFGTVEVSKKIDSFVPKGVEPTSANFTLSSLQQLLGKSSQPIKTWLLRQDKIVGIGNIYASEILYHAAIHPERSVGSLKAVEIAALHRGIKAILGKAIKNCGTTFSDFQSTLGETGTFQRYLKVYQREGGACKRCGGEVTRAVQAGRSTFCCVGCQR